MLAALAGTSLAAVAAPVAITGSMTYRQDFDSLGPATVAWTNDSTIPGWYAQINNGSTATGNAQSADGATVLSGLLNLGAPGAGDRALGSKCTGTGNFANIAYGVLFRNIAAMPVALTELLYTGELWRTNSGAGTPLTPVNEEFTVFYQVSDTPITNLLSGTGSASAAAGAGFTPMGAAADWVSPINTPFATALDGNLDANRQMVLVAPLGISVLPGQYLMIKWTDANEAGTDGFQGIDNVRLSFTAMDSFLTPSVSAITRVDAGVIGEPADDTFGFTVRVTGSGPSLGLGWTTTDVAPPNGAASNLSGAPYGTDVTWTGFPVTGPKTVTFRDVIPAFTASVVVEVPRIIGSNTLTDPHGLIVTNGTAFSGWTVNETNRTSTQNNNPAQTDHIVQSAVVDLMSAPPARFSAELEAIGGSSSGFEAADSFALQLIIDGGSPVSVLGAADADSSGRLTGTSELPGGANSSVTYSFESFLPAGARSVQIRFIGNSNSPNETFILKNVSLAVAPSTRYVIGRRYFGGSVTDIVTPVSPPPDAAWINNATARTLAMTTGGTTDKVVLSEVIDLTAVGTVDFYATFHAWETSTGTNFETGDRFKAELILDGGPPNGQIVSLIAPWDTGDGTSNVPPAPNGPPNGYLNGYSGTATVAPLDTALAEYNDQRARDEFNRQRAPGSSQINNQFSLHYTIPAAVNSAQLKIAGAGISGSEFFSVSNVLFTTVPAGQDSDGDGVTDHMELADGTDPRDPASVFGVISITPDPGSPGTVHVAFPTVAGRVYRGYYSGDLLTWLRDDTAPLVTGNGTVQSWPLVPEPAPGSRRYLRVLTGYTAADFPATMP